MDPTTQAIIQDLQGMTIADLLQFSEIVTKAMPILSELMAEMEAADQTIVLGLLYATLLAALVTVDGREPISIDDPMAVLRAVVDVAYPTLKTFALLEPDADVKVTH